jgi:hypothetical protein
VESASKVTYLGVVVDHHSLLSKRVEGASSVHGAPIEFDRTTNTVYSRAKDKDTVVVECDVVGGGVVGGVKIVCLHFMSVFTSHTLSQKIYVRLRGTPPRVYLSNSCVR